MLPSLCQCIHLLHTPVIGLQHQACFNLSCKGVTQTCLQGACMHIHPAAKEACILSASLHQIVQGCSVVCVFATTLALCSGCSGGQWGWSAVLQVYLMLSCCPCEGRISGIVDSPNACCTLAIPIAIFDQVIPLSCNTEDGSTFAFPACSLRCKCTSPSPSLTRCHP